MNTNIPIITPPLRCVGDTNLPLFPPSRPPDANTQTVSRFTRFELLLRSLLQARDEWAALIVRMHDEHNMDFRTIAWFVGEPITLVRRHYHRATHCPQPTTLIVQ